MNMRGMLVGLVAFAATAAPTSGSAATAAATDLETYSVGSIHGQDGWSSLGASGSGCAVYDHRVVDNTTATDYEYDEFGTRSLRMSNAVVSGCFGDQTFSKATADAAGESTAGSDGMTGPITERHFDASWDFASAFPTAEQPGLSVVASPDRGDGARMSWIQMADTPGGLEVNFYEYVSGAAEEGCTTGANFVPSQLVTGLDRTEVHNIRVIMDLLEGPSNDIVNVYVDGILADPNSLGHTGQSWEGYFRECEENPTRPVDSILFRTGGLTPVPDTFGKGFLIDNLNMATFTSDTAVTADAIIEVGIPPQVHLAVSARLADEFGNSMPGRTIDFSAGGTPLCSAVTGNVGVASCLPSVDGYLAIVQAGGYTASYAGESGYNASSGDGALISGV